MEWTISFIIASALLAAGIVGAFVLGSRLMRTRLLKPLNLLIAGVALSSFVLVLPVYNAELETYGCGPFEAFLNSMVKVFRLFGGHNELTTVITVSSGAAEWVADGYRVLFSVLMVLAPALTFGLALSFVKNLSAYRHYITHYRSDAYIFSELNERSLELARSLHGNDPHHRVFIFTDVIEKKEEKSLELIERAKELGAVCFKKDIVTVKFSFHSKKSKLCFFAIGADESENVSQSLKLIEKMRTRDNTDLYVFSIGIEAEMLLSGIFGGQEADAAKTKIKVRRVNEVQSLVLRTLYESGYEKIFASALGNGAEKEKEINALVLGMGRHGSEMTKALSWFCQMDGYRVSIDSFDIDKSAEDKFVSLCPELMDEKHNGNFEGTGEAKYRITVHPGTDVFDASFDRKLESLPAISYVFISLGSDERNLSAAVKLRTLFERRGCHPVIQAVISVPEKKEALYGVCNFKGQEYDVDFIGDIRESYSEQVILDSDVERLALERHMKWGEEEQFWRYSYNYKSSVASAVHSKMKRACGIPGADKAPEERTETELWALRRLEHRRWNAYMRSEGYVYGGTVEPSGRNDLAKKHNCLVDFDLLPLKEQEKDDD